MKKWLSRILNDKMYAWLCIISGVLMGIALLVSFIMGEQLTVVFIIIIVFFAMGLEYYGIRLLKKQKKDNLNGY